MLTTTDAKRLLRTTHGDKPIRNFFRKEADYRLNKTFDENWTHVIGHDGHLNAGGITDTMHVAGNFKKSSDAVLLVLRTRRLKGKLIPMQYKKFGTCKHPSNQKEHCVICGQWSICMGEYPEENEYTTIEGKIELNIRDLVLAVRNTGEVLYADSKLSETTQKRWIKALHAGKGLKCYD